MTDNKNTGVKNDVGCSGLVEEQEENRTLYIPHQKEGARPPAAGDSSCSRQLHSSPATAQRITLNQGMITCRFRRLKQSKNDNMICCDRENGTNDCAQLHKEVRQLLTRLCVTNGNRREAVPQIHGRRLPAGNFVGVGRELAVPAKCSFTKVMTVPKPKDT